MGAKLYRAEVRMDGEKDRQTDRHGEPNCRFRSFAKAHMNNFFYVSITTPHFSRTPNDVSIYPASLSKSVFKS